MGEVRSKSYENVWEFAFPGMLLHPGGHVQTGMDGWAAILMADESMIQLHRNSDLIFKQVSYHAGWLDQKSVQLTDSHLVKGSFYRLMSGEMWLRNKNRTVDIDVETPTITAGIRGTEVNIRIDRDQTVFISILEGSVRAWNREGSIHAGQNEIIVARPGIAPIKRLLMTPEDIVQWTLFIPPIFDNRSFALSSKNRQIRDRELYLASNAIALSPKDPSALVRMAMIYRDLGIQGKSRELLTMALKYDPVNEKALTTLGWVELDENNLQAALQSFNRVKRPSPLTYLGLGVSYLRQGRTKEAKRVLSIALKAHPDNKHLLLIEAMLNLQIREISKADQLLQRLVRKEPDYELAHGLSSIVSLALNKKKGAIESALRAVSLAPENTNARVILSTAYQANFNLPQAQDVISIALQVDPENITALLTHARLLFSSDYNQEAARAIQTARRLAPRNPEVWNLMGFLLLAQRKTDQAIDAFQNAIRLDSGIGEPHMGLALALMRRGNASMAIEEISTAVLLEPRRSLFLSYWAKMLYQLKRFDRALEVLDTAFQLDPRDPTPHLYRAIILRDLNRPTEAIEAMQQAVARNDNRAVYRSRFLLDRDLAVKHVNQTILYNQLGLTEWARSKALASVETDYTNSAGHVFLAGALLDMENRLRAGSSENLLGLLLQPANLNSFNTFQTYTPFFEIPDTNILLTGSIGTQHTSHGDVITYGYLPDANLSYNAMVAFTDTDGWRETNFFERKGIVGSLKWDPSPNDGLLLIGNYANSKEGDNTIDRFEVDASSQPLDHLENKGRWASIGYHHHFSPGTDYLFHYKYQDTSLDFFSQTNITDIGTPDVLLVSNLDSRLNLPFHQIQPHMLKTIGSHQLIFGTFQYWRDKGNESLREDAFYIRTPDGLILAERLHSEEAIETSDRYQSYYLKDIWGLVPNLSIHAALYYDRLDLSNVFTDTEWEQSDINPQLGFVWKPTSKDTLRLGGFRYLVPPNIERLDPTNIAGIWMLRNASEGTLAKEADLLWEREWKTGFLWTNFFYQKSQKTELIGDETELNTRGRLKGLEAAWNQIICHGLGLRAGYRYIDVTNDVAPLKDRRDHLASLELNYIHPTGFSTGLKEVFRYEDFTRSGRENEEIWLTDAWVGYELPGKRGMLKLFIGNVFDHQFNWVTDDFVFTGRMPTRNVLATLSLFF